MSRIITFLLIVYAIPLFGQQESSERCPVWMLRLQTTKEMKVIPYKDKLGNYGLKSRDNDSIIISAHYKKIIYNFNDTNFIVQSNDCLFGAINLKGEVLAPFYFGTYYFNYSKARNNFGNILACPVYVDFMRNETYFYFVNQKGECIPSDYHPCPANIPIDNANISKSLEYIQKAEEALIIDRLSAVCFCNEAIAADSLNPAVYYFAIRLLMDNNALKNGKENFLEYEYYYSWIEDCIQKGLLVETDNAKLLSFNQYKKFFYKHYIPDKILYNEAKKEIKRLKKIVKRDN